MVVVDSPVHRHFHCTPCSFVIQWSLGYRTRHIGKSLNVRNRGLSTRIVPSIFALNQRLLSTLGLEPYENVPKVITSISLLTFGSFFQRLYDRRAANKPKKIKMHVYISLWSVFNDSRVVGQSGLRKTTTSHFLHRALHVWLLEYISRIESMLTGVACNTVQE